MAWPDCQRFLRLRMIYQDRQHISVEKLVNFYTVDQLL